jgi:hypothetical protein
MRKGEIMRRNVLVAQVVAGATLCLLAGCGDEDGGNAPVGIPPTFTEIQGLGLTETYFCSLAWGDCDDDGDLDLAVAGYTDSDCITKVYENVGGAVPFDGTEVATGLTGVGACSLAWGDADNDGDLDLAVAGLSGSGRTTKVYKNDGAGGFTEITNPSLTGVADCSLAWGDCDSDGDLDLAVAGCTAGSDFLTTVYENDGAGGFTEFRGLGLTGVWNCSLAWGDAEGDGDLDLAVAGYTGGTACVTKVYRNVGGAVPFDGTEIATGLTGVGWCSLAWGDSDNDGDLDLAVAVAGENSVGTDRITTVYENHGSLPNVPPDAPTGLEAFPAGADTILAWEESFDPQTPVEGLSYNVEVWRTPGGLGIAPGMAAEDGWRRVPAMGMVRPTASYPAWVISDLPTGAYVFRVQAIDSGLEGGPWSEPCLFAVP